MKIKIFLFSLCIFLFTFTSLSFSTELSEVFSERYLRTESSSNVTQDSFSVTPGEGIIFIENGAEEIHATMVSSAEVWVNEMQIFGPSNFNNNISSLQKQVNLSDVNSIRVVLNSKPGSFIRVRVFAESSGDSFIYPAYRTRDVEDPVEKTNTQVQGSEAMTSSLSVQCNAPEVGSPIPFPTTAASMNGKFYLFTGETVEWVPPDPGEAGKTIIIGVDSDGDCIRDDIERFIARLLPNSNQVLARKYMFEYAKWLGLFLSTTPLVESDAQIISINSYKSIHCVRQILGDTESTKRMLNQVFAQFHNTLDRSYKFIENSSLLGGWTSRDSFEMTCD